MAEYIEREAAIAYAPLPKHLREYQTMNLDDAWEDGYDFAIRQIESIPAADVRPVVRGKWLQYSPLADTYECDKCGYQVIDESFRTNFCPNCGADMREPPKEET